MGKLIAGMNLLLASPTLHFHFRHSVCLSFLPQHCFSSYFHLNKQKQMTSSLQVFLCVCVWLFLNFQFEQYYSATSTALRQ